MTQEIDQYLYACMESLDWEKLSGQEASENIYTSADYTAAQTLLNMNPLNTQYSTTWQAE
jgi:hypothetical protein